mmetsp:Transcript_8047/g.19956  ORF Transcript_8047/g.19956 Transcript_8047/m.19956 type:complete len:102 (-) Transcript_8047:141-446(-)
MTRCTNHSITSTCMRTRTFQQKIIRSKSISCSSKEKFNRYNSATSSTQFASLNDSYQTLGHPCLAKPSSSCLELEMAGKKWTCPSRLSTTIGTSSRVSTGV